MKKTNKKGFTLVELVIVIAVIAILAAVLLPTFSGIIAKAKNSALAQEAKNLYTQYVVDNADKGEIKGDVYVKVGKGSEVVYVHVKDGAVVMTNNVPELLDTTQDGNAIKDTVVTSATSESGYYPVAANSPIFYLYTAQTTGSGTESD